MPTLRSALGIFGLLSAAILFLTDGLRRPELKPRRAHPSFILAQAPAAFLSYWGLQGTMPLSLFVVVAAQFPRAFSRRGSLLLVTAMTLLLLVIRDFVPHAGAPRDIVAYFGFQVFAVLTVSYAISARRAHDTIRRVNGELLATRHLLHESARTEERLRLSRELHDVVGHKLTALKLQLRELASTSPLELRDVTTACSHLADELLTEVRNVVSTLRNSEPIDLQSSLSTLVASLPHPDIELHIPDDLHISDIELATTLLRCIQEGLTNALKHSNATYISVSLLQDPSGVTLTVDDNGRGQDVPRLGNGLIGMQERLEMLGGTLEIVSQIPNGFGLRAWLPNSKSIGTRQ